MRLLAFLFSTLQSSKTATVVTSPFWNNLKLVNKLHDPPPVEILKEIQKNPWKGALEPVDPAGIPLHEAKVIEGEIPTDLKGVLCRNGAGRIRIGDTKYGGWFDGDGFVTCLSIDGASQKATYAGKYVETKRFKSQQRIQQKQGNVPVGEAGVWTKRGEGKWWQNLIQMPTNPSNTNVLFFPNPKDEKTPIMYALAEGGDPVQMDPKNLKTIGPTALKSKSGERVKSFFSAHTTEDPVTGEVFNHGLVIGPQIKLNLMKLDGFGNLLKQHATDLPFTVMVHDNVISQRFFVALLPPWLTTMKSIFETIFGGNSLAKQFSWNPQGDTETTAMIFSKETLKCVVKVALPLLSTYHLIDAFEDDNDPNILTLRILVHDPNPSARAISEAACEDIYKATNIPLCSLMEYKVDVKAARLLSGRKIIPAAAPCELPDVNAKWGYRKRYVYTNSRENGVECYTNSIQKIDLELETCSDVISFGEGVYAGGPLFVPKENAHDEDDGYIFTQLYRSKDHGSDVCILDAKTMQKIALLRLDARVPFQFHGTWYGGFTQS